MPVREGDFLWQGSREFVERTHLHAFMRWLRLEHGRDFADYEALRAWSVADIEEFWARVWEYFRLISTTPYERVLAERRMPGAQWFKGSLVNYAEHVLRHEAVAPDATVLHHASEIRALSQMSWNELGSQVRTLATQLRALDVRPGDRVVSYLPNIAETVVAMLATTAIGAIWSAAAPEFGTQTVVDRFAQIAPKLLFAADGYRFDGKDFDRRDAVVEIASRIASLQTVVWLDYLRTGPPPSFNGVTTVVWRELLQGPPAPASGFQFERVPHDHPLWVLFSSGTTGLPKPIVHSHVGILVEHYKMGAFHLDLQPSSVLCFYSTTGWMMWNSLMLAPLAGGAAVLYDGSPTHPDPDFLWSLAAQTGATVFGASPAYIQLMRKQNIVPSRSHDVSRIDTIFLAGSPSTPETFEWFYRNVKDELWVTSQSGGTEFCSGVVVAAPSVPVYAGEIQVRALGVDVRAFDDDGRELIDQVGEMVIAQPMPSMPLFFWGDDAFARYREAYFDTYPGVWRHGDFIKINRRGGCYVYGRSDSTLNRHGVRIGSAEIYRTLEAIEEVLDSLVICIEEPGGGYYMPLFVQLRPGATLSDDLIANIKHRLRSERSPRHVPDEIVAVPAIPYTLSGKKMEVPVRKLLMGWPAARCFSRDAMKDGAAMDWYLALAAGRLHGNQDATLYAEHVGRRSTAGTS